MTEQERFNELTKRFAAKHPAGYNKAADNGVRIGFSYGASYMLKAINAAINNKEERTLEVLLDHIEKLIDNYGKEQGQTNKN